MPSSLETLSSSSAVLPTPGSPVITSVPPTPRRAALTSRRIASRSASLPRTSGSTGEV